MFVLSYAIISVLQGEKVGSIRQRIRDKLDVPEKEFEKVLSLRFMIQTVVQLLHFASINVVDSSLTF